MLSHAESNFVNLFHKFVAWSCDAKQISNQRPQNAIKTTDLLNTGHCSPLFWTNRHSQKYLEFSTVHIKLISFLVVSQR